MAVMVGVTRGREGAGQDLAPAWKDRRRRKEPADAHMGAPGRRLPRHVHAAGGRDHRERRAAAHGRRPAHLVLVPAMGDRQLRGGPGGAADGTGLGRRPARPPAGLPWPGRVRGRVAGQRRWPRSPACSSRPARAGRRAVPPCSPPPSPCSTPPTRAGPGAPRSGIGRGGRRLGRGRPGSGRPDHRDLVLAVDLLRQPAGQRGRDRPHHGRFRDRPQAGPGPVRPGGRARLHGRRRGHHASAWSGRRAWAGRRLRPSA